MKYFNYKYILIILFFILIYFYIRNYSLIENFEDKFNQFEKYEEIYDKEFIDLYEIIYRDFSDIDYDTNIIYSKCFNNINKDDISIMIGGSGIGKTCYKIKEKYKNIIGVDISENILKKAQYIYPNIKFIRGDLRKENIFEKNKFSHIYIDERTLYYNKFEEMKEIIINSVKWLKENGYLIVHIYDPHNLQLACRYYTSKYIDNKGNIHGFTYLNDFSHDCYYLKDESNNDTFEYFDKIIFDTGEKRIKKTIFYIPEKEKVYDMILNNGFDLIYIEKIRIQIVGGYDLAIFKKKKQTMTVDEIENK
jgi:ubiquinone/menaquinone biosynthesis C-methylase UbiE